ncbi:MAG: phosphatidylserine/phosphatidylglycerophosphate/cardiolipin synthase family protein [Methanobacterium sp.]|nr:phosphatidylserine/phosphatidylglycerophosphate/cardiolipin synthase family protein [Methanobacterium sp.]
MIKGRIVDAAGNPIEGLVVVVKNENKYNIYDYLGTLMDSINNLSLDPIKFGYLGKASTNRDGYYHISYNLSEYRHIHNKKSIKLIVKDSYGLFEHKVEYGHIEIKNNEINVDDIILDRSMVNGSAITLGRNIVGRLTDDNYLEILIDNESLFKRVVKSINNANHHVYLTQYEFFPDLVATFNKCPDGEYKPQDVLGDIFLKANDRGVDIRIIINENLIIPDSIAAMDGFFENTGINYRRFISPGPHILHAKILSVDGKEAYIMGSPFSQSYWDSQEHIINDTRRSPNYIKSVHDVSIYLKGSSVNHIEDYFAEIWNYLSDRDYEGEDKISRTSEGLSAGNQQVQIARTVTPDILSKEGEKGILEGYVRAIKNAEEYIYLENQFFTNKAICDSLKRALNSNPDLQLILCINEFPDLPPYREYQKIRLREIGFNPNKEQNNPQIGVFTLWSADFNGKMTNLQQCYVHSKVAIVDDKKATIGTANIDGPSLNYADEFKFMVDPKYQRSMEINAFLFDEDSQKSAAKKIRNDLWSEHLGIVISDDIPEGGWLELWNKAAYNNIMLLKGENPHLNGHILPYGEEINAATQIKSFGANMNKINIIDFNDILIDKIKGKLSGKKEFKA